MDTASKSSADTGRRWLAWHSWYAWALTGLAVLLTTLAMVAVEDELRMAHVVLAFQLLVIAGTVLGGRALGLSVAITAFALMTTVFSVSNFPLNVARPLDWLVLVAFLMAAGVTTYLLSRLKVQAREARDRALEVERLARVASESLSAGTAREALDGVSLSVRETLGVDFCEIVAGSEEAADSLHLPHETILLALRTGAVAFRALHGGGAVHTADRDLSESEFWRAMAQSDEIGIPLLVHNRAVGVMRLGQQAGFRFSVGQRRLLDALTYYAALGAERVRLEAEASNAVALREAVRLKDEVLASVSHDLRTPLTAIKATAQALAADGDPRGMEIVVQADRLNRLVTDVLDLSRLRAGEMPLQMEENTVDDLVGVVRRELTPGGAVTRLLTRIDNNEPAMVGRFDLPHSSRILSNLLQNAFRYSPADREVELVVSRQEDDIVFAVLDRGPGIVPEEGERIFEPFYRAPGAPSDSRAAGLGLAISRQLAERQTGTLTMSPRDGGGSVFTLRLRAVQASASL